MLVKHVNRAKQRGGTAERQRKQLGAGQGCALELAAANAATTINVGVLDVLCCNLQGFEWDALAARRMEPPRKPKMSDHAKRKASATCND
jgi:hypothetical protein